MDLRTSDGVYFYCLPDCARCKLSGESPEHMIECPKGRWACVPEYCEEYVEEWWRESK